MDDKSINEKLTPSPNAINFKKSSTNFVFLAGIFIIIGLGIISVYQFYNLLTANRWVAHTYRVIGAAQDSLYQLTYLESRQRGYIIFNDPIYLATYNDNVTNLKKSLSSLINLTKDNTAQQEKVRKLSDLIYKRIYYLNRTLQIKNKESLTNPANIILFQQGQALSDEIRSLTNDFIGIEVALLNERNDNAINNATLTNIIFITGQVISLIFLFAAFLLFNRELSKRRQAEIKIQSIENQLRSIIEGAHDMIAALDRNYRFIIFNHAYEKEFQRLFNTQIHVGMSLDQALAHSPNALEKLKDSWKQSLEGKEYVKNIELDVHNQKHVFEVTSSLIKDHENKILGACHINRNITERLKKENELNKGLNELKDKNEKITLLLDMSDVMLACYSIDELSTITSKYCGKILNFSKGIFYIMHPSKDFLEESANWGSPISDTNNFNQDQCWALRLGHIHHAGFSDTELICEHINNPGHEKLSYLCVPLRAQNDIYGLLYIEVDQQLSSNERLLVNAFAELTALALGNVRLRENLSYQSLRDPLTSLYNRRYLEEFLAKQIYQSERTKKPISVLMLDLDHFKRINDVNGHEAGDLILKQLGQLLIKETRAGDIAARYGGEEFVIILYNTNGKIALKRANDIRNLISLLHVKFGAQETGEITASIGISEYPDDGKTGPNLIEAADKALYVAKNTGRNKVVLYAQAYEQNRALEKQ